MSTVAESMYSMGERMLDSLRRENAALKADLIFANHSRRDLEATVEGLGLQIVELERQVADLTSIIGKQEVPVNTGVKTSSNPNIAG